MEKNKELRRNTLIFGLGRIGTKMVQFVLIPLYTLYLTTSDYSTSDLIHSTVTLLIPFLTLGLEHGLLRFALGNQKRGGTILRFSLAVSLSGTMVLFCLLPVFRAISLFQGKEIYIPVLFCTNSLSHILGQYCKAIEKNIQYALYGIITAFSSAFLSWLFIVPFHMGIDGYLLASVLAGLISTLYLSIVCQTVPVIINAEKNRGVIIETLRFSIPLMPNDLAWWIIQVSDRYMVAAMCGAAINGIYTIAYKIPGIFNVLVSVFISAFSITTFKEFDKKDANGKVDSSYFESVFSKYLALTFIVVSAVILIVQPAAYFLIKKDFYESWKYTPFLLVAFAIGNLESFLGSILAGIKRTNVSFISTAVGAILNILLNVTLIPILQVYGAIAATIIGYFAVYIIRLIGVKKYLEINLSVIKSISSIIIILIISFLYICRTLYIRILAIPIFFLIIVIYRKDVMIIVKVSVTSVINCIRKIIGRLQAKLQ